MGGTGAGPGWTHQSWFSASDVIDLQHGAGSEGDIPAMAAAVELAGAVPMVRTRSASFSDVGRAIDLGARGVFVPNVLGVEHAAQIVASCRYGPEGGRSIGRLVGDVESPLLFLLIESAGALADLDAIFRLDGVDGIYVGGYGLSLSLGRRRDAADAEYMEELTASIVARSLAAGVPVGVHAADGKGAAKGAEMGCTIVTAAMDLPVLEAALRAELDLSRPVIRHDPTVLS